MMAGPPQLQLRVLYTINSSPQYILARSHSLVPVTTIPRDDTSIRTNYATVSLKACLDTICRSSPELIQDNNRDYSVYVLDPLESNSAPAPMNISNATKSKQAVEKPLEQPCGVAVGLGLMSWALHENDGAAVTGTQVKLNTGQEALEVIFALRETAAMQRASLSSTMRSWGLPLGMSLRSMPPHTSTPPSTVDPHVISLLNPLPGPSTPASTSRPEHHSVDNSSQTLRAIQARNKVKSKPKKVSKSLTTPTTESDKLMYASETYIGPLKKKGRPKSLASSAKASKNGAVEGQANVGISYDLDASVQATDGLHVVPSTSLADASLMPTQPSIEGSQSLEGQASLLDLLTALSSCDVPNTQNAHLLAALSTIDSSNLDQPPSSESNPALVNAIKHLLQTVYPQQPSQQPSDDSGTNRSTAANAAQDEDVVILDKENVDPMMFRRRPDKESSDPKEIWATQLTASTNAPTDLTNSRILSQRSGGQENATAGSAMRRKRTLSDFMDEKESERDKQREKERSERREHHRHSQTRARKASGSSSIYDTGLRHYPRLADEALPRPGINSYYRMPLEFRSSPPRPKADVGSMSYDLARSTYLSERKAPASSPPRPNVDLPLRRRYVVPEWARTNTATQPRLSEEAQRALAEAEERKKKEKETRKKALGYTRPKQEIKVESKANQTRPGTSLETSQPKPPAPLAAGNSCPVFAAANVSGDIFSSSHSRGSSSPPCSPPGSSIPVPQTPPRKRSAPLFTPDYGSNSLFTPTPKSRSGRFPGSTETSRFTHGNLPPPSPSPSTARTNSTKMSPIQAIISGQNIGDASGWNAGSTMENEDGWDGPDGPPSSLPTASDAEDDAPTSSAFEAESGDAEEQEGYTIRQRNVKQHWPGLPPSSPPPPSSPSLIPQDQDDDDVELTDLPVPTSDIEDSISPPPVDDQQPNEESIETTKDEFDSFFTSLSSDGSVPSDIDFFSHLSTGIHEQNEDNNTLPMLDSSLDPIFQNGLVDFDFTEFWESFKPMVEDHTSRSGTADPNMTLDHFKVAEDVQALFSGCLM